VGYEDLSLITSWASWGRALSFFTHQRSSA